MADQIPFKEAISFLEGKVNLPTKRSDDLKHGAHVRAFSVAGVTRDDMLADFRTAIEKARREGTGFNEFRKDFDAIVERTGWKFFSHGKTDEERHAWRARVIYAINMRTSYMAGRYAQLTDPDILRYRPYWRYLHSGALHPRKLHLSWNGKVWLASDPVWKKIYPPNGWFCGCDVEALSERQFRALGLDGPDPSPDLTPYEDIDPRTGQPEMRIPGIDRGWEYNVGMEWLDGLVPPELHEPLPAAGETPSARDLPEMPPATQAKADDVLAPDLEPEDYVAAFLRPFDLSPGEDGYFRDVSGGIITVSQRLFEQRDASGTVISLKSGKRGRGQYAKLLADTIIAPDEIWADWAQMKSGFVLRRAYLKRVMLPDGRSLFVRFEWTSKGWAAVTGFDTTESYLENYRRGALLYRKR